MGDHRDEKAAHHEDVILTDAEALVREGSMWFANLTAKAPGSIPKRSGPRTPGGS